MTARTRTRTSTDDRGVGKPRSRGTLPLLRADGDADYLRAWLTRALSPPEGWRFDRFERAGRRKDEPCSITIRNGREDATYRFDRQSDLYGAQLRAMLLATSDGQLRPPHLTATEIEDVWAALCQLGRVLSTFDARDEARKWVETLLDSATPLRGHTLTVGDQRHNALMALRLHGEFTLPDALALLRPPDDGGGQVYRRRPIRLVDADTGEHWLRAGETGTYIRHVVGVAPLPHNVLRARLAEIDVHAQRFEDHRPPHPKAMLYLLPEPLVEYATLTDARAEAAF